jgi:molybdate transport system regulatory protein
MAKPVGALKLKAQLFCGDEIAMGPGKAALLEAIIREGSISAAGRALGMSYRRTWMLVDVMNRSWIEPLVETEVGGRRGGGAKVTGTGRAVLAAYAALMDEVSTIADAHVATLSALLRTAPRPAQKA